MSAMAYSERDFALELHGLLRDLDRRSERETPLRSRLVELKSRAQDLIAARRARRQSAEATGQPAMGVEGDRPHGQADQVHDELSRVVELVEPYTGAVAEPHTQVPASRLRELRDRLAPAYERLAAALSDLSIHVPSLRPTNYRRNIFHVACAVGVVAIIAFTPPTFLVYVAGAALIWAWGMEISRRVSERANRFLMWVFSPVAHPHEAHRVNSATWYVTAIFILALWDQPLAGAIGIAVLGLGDPAAAIVGRRFGRVKLVHGRTLEGSLAFVLAGGLFAFGVYSLFTSGLIESYITSPAISLGSAALVCGLSALVGAVAELFSKRVDDNFSITLTAAGAAVALMSLFAG